VDYVHNLGKLNDANYAAWQYYNPEGSLYNDEAIYTLFDEFRESDGTFRGMKLTEDQLKFIEGFSKGYDAENKWGSMENLAGISDLNYYGSETAGLFYEALGLDPEEASPSDLVQRLTGFDDGWSLEAAFVEALMGSSFGSPDTLVADTVIDDYVNSLPTAESVDVAGAEDELIKAY
jgi:hypothetical protein